MTRERTIVPKISWDDLKFTVDDIDNIVLGQGSFGIVLRGVLCKVRNKSKTKNLESNGYLPTTALNVGSVNVAVKVTSFLFV